MKLSLAVLASFVAVGCTASMPEGTSAPESNSADGGVPQCANLAAGPVAPQLVGQLFQGSEDFAFDGKGHIVGKRGSSLVSLTAAAGATPTTLAQLPGQTYGVRYLPNGNLAAAIPGAGKVVLVKPDGQVADLATGLSSPNGVYADADSNVWVTEFGGSRVIRIAPDGTKTVVVSGANAQSANGVLVDSARKLLFYTEYSKGKIHRLDLAAEAAQPVLVASVPGAALDGMVLDACGNVYAVDQKNSRLYRVRTDAQGAATAAAELVASFPTNVANALFGVGEGFDATKLYVTGNPGSVYTVDLGVGGAPVPLPE